MQTIKTIIIASLTSNATANSIPLDNNVIPDQFKELVALITLQLTPLFVDTYIPADVPAKTVVLLSAWKQ